MRQAQEVGPEFSFRKHDQLWLQSPKIGPDRERKIHRKIEDVLFAKALAGKLLSGISGSRDQHAMHRKAAAHLLYQSADSQHLTDRNCVNPDHSPGLANRSS